MFALVHDLFLKTVCKTPKHRRHQPELVSMAWRRLSRMLLQGLGGGVCGEPHKVKAGRTPGIDTQAKFSSRRVVFGHYFQWIMNWLLRSQYRTAELESSLRQSGHFERITGEWITQLSYNAVNKNKQQQQVTFHFFLSITIKSQGFPWREEFGSR